MTLTNKMPNWKGIPVCITTGEALVGHIKEWVVLLLLQCVTDFSPLSFRRINASWVMGAGMEENDAALGSRLDIRNHAIEIQSNRLLVVVSVFFDLEP